MLKPYSQGSQGRMYHLLVHNMLPWASFACWFQLFLCRLEGFPARSIQYLYVLYIFHNNKLRTLSCVTPIIEQYSTFPNIEIAIQPQYKEKDYMKTKGRMRSVLIHRALTVYLISIILPGCTHINKRMWSEKTKSKQREDSNSTT